MLLQFFQIELFLPGTMILQLLSQSLETDTSVINGYAQFGVASVSGRTMEITELKAQTTLFKSDINDAHYHNGIFTNLEPNTLYAYRIEMVKTGQSFIILKPRT